MLKYCPSTIYCTYKLKVMTTVMTAIVVKVLTFLKRLVVKSSHSHDCWSEVRSQVIVKCRKRADCSQSHVYDYDFSHTSHCSQI